MQLVHLLPVQLCELTVTARQPVVLGFIGSYRLLWSTSTNKGGVKLLAPIAAPSMQLYCHTGADQQLL